MKLLKVPVPRVDFENSGPFSGDLISISGLKDFPVTVGDNWEAIFKNGDNWEADDTIGFGGYKKIINSTNERALSSKYVWVIGDSFSTALLPYMFATFQTVSYLGHWQETFNSLADKLNQADVKPDLIIVIRTERSF